MTVVKKLPQLIFSRETQVSVILSVFNSTTGRNGVRNSVDALFRSRCSTSVEFQLKLSHGDPNQSICYDLLNMLFL